MFTAELSDTGLLKDSLQSVSNIITEGVFQVSEDGIELVAADPAMVAMVDFTIETGAFDSFECEEPQKLGVNIENLYSILRRAGSDDKLVLGVNEDESKLTLTMENQSTRNFSLALLNLDEDDIPSTDDLEFTVTANLATGSLSNAIGDAAVVGDAVSISADGDELVLTAEGDSSNAATHIGTGSDGMNELEADGPVASMFSLDYLNKMMKASKMTETVTVRLGDDFPMRMEFEVPDKVSLSYILAPRIEE